MNPEEIAELKELIEFLKENNIGEFDLERGDLKVRLKFAGSASRSGRTCRRWRSLAARCSRQPSRSELQPAARWRMRIRAGGAGRESCGCVAGGR